MIVIDFDGNIALANIAQKEIFRMMFNDPSPQSSKQDPTTAKKIPIHLGSPLPPSGGISPVSRQSSHLVVNHPQVEQDDFLGLTCLVEQLRVCLGVGQENAWIRPMSTWNSVENISLDSIILGRMESIPMVNGSFELHAVENPSRYFVYADWCIQTS